MNVVTNPNLYVVVGLPGCGKSTFAHKFISEERMRGKEVKYLSTDSLRGIIGESDEDMHVSHKVFKHVRLMVNFFLSHNQDVLVDATNITVSQRGKYVRIGQKYNADMYAFILPLNDIQELMNRNEIRKSKGGRFVPIDVIERMKDDYVEPSFEEGFTFICKQDD
jgi:predicted kinase